MTAFNRSHNRNNPQPQQDKRVDENSRDSLAASTTASSSRKRSILCTSTDNSNSSSKMSSNQVTSPDPEAALSAAIETSEEIKSSAGSSLKSFLAGGIGGVMAVLVGHPFDLVKVRMQTGTVTGGANVSVLGAMRQTLVQEGVRGLYRGVSAPLVASTPIYAMSFWGYDIGQRLVRFVKKDPDGQLSLPDICLAGGFSALPTTLVMAPTERIKCLLQVQSHAAGGKPQYTGMVDCGMQVYRQGGITSVYKGTMLTLMRDVPGSIAWFGTYELGKRAIQEMQGIEDPSKLSPLAVMTAGGFAGMACWGVSIAPDVLKSRYQTAPEGKYSSVFDVYRTLVKEEGYGALFTGFRPAMIRAFPANAACFLGMELGRKAFAFLD